MYPELCEAQKEIMSLVGQKVFLEMTSHQKYDGIEIKHIDPFHMIFTFKLSENYKENLILPMKSIYQMKYKEESKIISGKILESHKKQYESHAKVI